jgi:hypothetical protein
MGNRWYIHIIESPHEEDLKSDRCEGRVLSEMLKLIGIESEYRMVRTARDWEMALEEFITHVKGQNRTPVLHISMHGCDDNLWLTDGSKLMPEVLREQMRRVKACLDGKLIVCLSACAGFLPAAKACEGDVPFGMLLAAPVAPVGWDEAAVWYCVFYYRLYHDPDPTKAGRAAGDAVGKPELFACITEDTLAEVLRRRTPATH